MYWKKKENNVQGYVKRKKDYSPTIDQSMKIFRIIIATIGAILLITLYFKNR